MKKQIFIVSALSLCLLMAPSWAMNGSDEQSDSSVSESSDCESTSEDTKSKTFFIHIANPQAGEFYKYLTNNYNLSVHEWRRAEVKQGFPAENDMFLRKTMNAENLCRTMKNVMRLFNATQTLSPALKGESDNGLLVTLTTPEEQSVKTVMACCLRSRYVYKVFADQTEWEKYLAVLPRISSSGICQREKEAALIASTQLVVGHDVHPCI